MELDRATSAVQWIVWDRMMNRRVCVILGMRCDCGIEATNRVCDGVLTRFLVWFSDVRKRCCDAVEEKVVTLTLIRLS